MRYLKLLLSLILFVSFCIQSRAQSPGQGINGNIDGVTIDYAQLIDGNKIKLSNGVTTSVKYNIDMSRSPSGSTWSPVNMKVGLGYKVGNDYKFFTGGHTFMSENFQGGMATLTKELTTVIDHSKLPAGAKIYVLYENHRPNVPESGWEIKALSFANNIVAYNFVPGTTTPDPGPGNPVIGVPPAFTVPIAGAVPLYEYVSTTKRLLSTTYYSSYPGYTYGGVLGFVFTSATAGTVPLHKYVQSSNGNCYYTLNQGTYTGYTYQGIACYVYANQITKTLPVYEHYLNSSQGFHRYSNTPGSFYGLSFEDVKFFVLQNEQITDYPLPEEDCAELYQYYSDTQTDHFYTTTKKNHQPNYVYERVLGYIYTVQKSGTVPLYIYYSELDNDHYYTLVRQSYNNYRYEGIVGYVYASSGLSGTVPIYEYWNLSSSDHYFTTLFQTPAYYEFIATRFYMLQYNH